MSEPRGLWTIKPSEHAHLVGRAEKAEAERDAYRAALQRILDHGETHDEPCWALHNGDCADVMQEIARDALAGDHDQGAQQ